MSEDDELLLYPYRGVNTMTFGMSEAEIAGIAGAPDRVSISYTKNKVEVRSDMNVSYSAGLTQGVAHFGIGRRMRNTWLGEIQLFAGKPKSVLKKICALDSDPRLFMGFVILYDLGMTLTGFYDNDASQRATTLFVKGTHDARRPKTEPFQP